MVWIRFRMDIYKCPSCSGSKPFDSEMIFWKGQILKKLVDNKIMRNYRACKELSTSNLWLNLGPGVVMFELVAKKDSQRT